MPEAQIQQSLLSGFDSPLIGEIKNERSIMIYAFFSLCRSRVGELPVYDDGKVRIEVRAPEAIGCATIWDQELLIYVASLMVEKMNRGLEVEQTFTFTVHDFCRICGIKASGTAYERIEGALTRLQGTQIKTNIETGGLGQDQAFSWVENYRINYRRNKADEKVMQSVRVRLCDWLWRAIFIDKRILTYDRKYFDLPPLEKRLYEVARAHCGEQAGFRIGLEKLKRKVGSDSELKRFKLNLVQISKKRHPLPGYAFRLVSPAGPGRRPALKSTMVEFWNTGRSILEFRASALPTVE